jgi:hypothetical protein
MTFMPSCREVQTELTEYAEGTLPPGRRLGIWIHLLLCRACAGFLRGLRALPGVAKASLVPPVQAPEGATKALTEVLAALRKPSR